MWRSNKARLDRRNGGFTLIESLAALAVVAVALTALGMLISSNVRATRSLDERLALIETTRALLAALPGRDQLAPGDQRGEVADRRWRIDVMPFAADFVDPTGAAPWVPEAVVLRVEAPSGEILRIDTVRLRRQDSGQ